MAFDEQERTLTGAHATDEGSDQLELAFTLQQAGFAAGSDRGHSGAGRMTATPTDSAHRTGRSRALSLTIAAR